MLEKVISGGQTGANIAGLRAAKQIGFSTGGTAPKDFQTERGLNLDLGRVYGLRDHGTYVSRTIDNVKNSDGTIVFLVHATARGSTKTIGYCHSGKWIAAYKSKSDGFRPCLVITKSEMEEEHLESTCAKIARWILHHRLNCKYRRASAIYSFSQTHISSTSLEL
jgi:hypothetical protein